MKVAILLSSLLMALFASGASADCSALGCNDVYIENLYADSGELASGEIWVQTSGTETGLSCTPNAGIMLKLNPEGGATTHRKEVYALLMMAFSMDKPVTIRVVAGSGGECVIAYVTVQR